MRVSISNLIQKINLFALSFVIAVSGLSVLGPVLFSDTANAAPNTIYQDTSFGGLTWGVDRQLPTGGYSQTGDSLTMNVDSSVVPSSGFYAFEGLKAALPAGTTSVQADLYVDPAWESMSEPVIVGMWGQLTDPLAAGDAWPTLEFANDSGSPVVEVWDTFGGGALAGITNINYGDTVTLEIAINHVTDRIYYYLNGTEIFSSDSYNYEPLSHVIFNNYNSGVAGNSYITLWTNLKTGKLQLTAPALLTPTDNAYVNGISLTNSWSAVPGAVTYLYESFNDTAATSLRFSANYNTTSKSAANVADGVFWWRVTAIDQYGHAGISSPLWKVTIDHTAPAAPINGLPGITASNDFYFIWDAVTDSGSPIVEYQFQSSGSNATDVNGSLIGAWQNWVSGGVDQQHLTTPTIHSYGAPDGHYFWQVRAIDAVGNIGAWSTVWGTQIDSTAPSTPVNVGPSNGSTQQGSLTFDWLASTDSAPGTVASYQVQYSTSPSQAAGVLNGTVTTVSNILDTEQAVSGLTDGYIFWQVRAIDTAGNTSAWSDIWGYAIDTIAPVVTVDSLISNDSTPVLTGTVDDTTATVTIKVDGSTYSATNNGDGTWTAQVTFGLFDGTYNVEAKAQDLAGNIGSDATINEILIDAAKPKIKNISLSDTIINALDVSPILTAKLKGTGTNVADAQYKITNTLGNVIGWTNLLAGDESYDSQTELINSVIDVDALVDGAYTLKLRTFDVAGNARTKTLNFLVDRTAPVVDITNPTALYLQGAGIVVHGTIADTNLDTYKLTIKNASNVTIYSETNTAASATADYTWDTTAFADGVYTIKLRATDVAGNSTSTSKLFNVDNTAPTQPGTPTTVSPVSSQNVIWTWSASNDGAGSGVAVYEYNFNNESWLTTGSDQTTFATNGLTEGTHTLAIRAIDNAGNRSDPSDIGEVLIDLTAPDVAVAADPIDVGHNAPVQITGTIVETNAYTYTLTLNGDVVTIPVDFLTNGYTFDTTGLVSGPYVFVLSAIDGAGNSSTDTVTVTVDNTAPVITYTGYGQSGAVITPQITIAGESAFNWIASSANPAGTSFNSALESPSFTVVGTGTYSYALTAVDVYGNTTSFVFAFNYTAPSPVTPSTFTDVVVEQVLGEQTDQATTPDAASTSTDAVVAGAKDTSDGTLKIFGIAWYWILAIIGALLALWALLAALLRRRQQNS